MIVVSKYFLGPENLSTYYITSLKRRAPMPFRGKVIYLKGCPLFIEINEKIIWWAVFGTLW